MTIWKFPFHISEVQTISMPKGAKILSVQTQRGHPCLWAEVDPEAESQNIYLYIYGTGHTIKNLPQKFLGAVQMDSFVWHIYERI